MMLFCTAFLVALVTPSTTQAFTVSPAARPSHHTSTTTALAIPVPDVDPVVLAALGIAIVGGVGKVVLSGRIGGMDGDVTPVTTAAAAAPVADAPKEVVAEPTVDLSIPYDAVARLDYEATGSKGDHAAFKAKY
jgi:hypothetical protein